MSTETREAMTAKRMEEIRRLALDVAERPGGYFPGPVEEAVEKLVKAVPALLSALEEARTALNDLANVAGVAIGLRHVDFAAGEVVGVQPGVTDHALYWAMRETIRERDALAARVAELELYARNADATAQRNATTHAADYAALEDLRAEHEDTTRALEAAQVRVEELEGALAGRPCDDCPIVAKYRLAPAAPPEKAPAPEPLAPVDRVLADIRAERARQDAKWGTARIPTIPDGTGPEFARWAARAKAHCDEAMAAGRVSYRIIADEEIGEAYAESDPVRLRAELVQCAAVFAKWIQALDTRAPSGVVDHGTEPKPHVHRCMRCKQEFKCRNPEPGGCAAQYDVLPVIVTPEGVVEHCPPKSGGFTTEGGGR